MTNRVVMAIPLSLVLVTSACGASAPTAETTATGEIPRVAVFPSTWATESPSLPIDGARELARGLSLSGGAEIAPLSRVREQVEAAPPTCTEDLSCIGSIGQRLETGKVALVQLAELGRTVVVRVRFIDAAGATQEQTRQSVVNDATTQRVVTALRDLGQALGRPFAPEPDIRPPLWYERWWVWTIAGAVVVTASVATVLVVTAGADGQDPDFIITPP